MNVGTCLTRLTRHTTRAPPPAMFRQKTPMERGASRKNSVFYSEVAGLEGAALLDIHSLKEYTQQNASPSARKCARTPTMNTSKSVSPKDAQNSCKKFHQKIERYIYCSKKFHEKIEEILPFRKINCRSPRHFVAMFYRQRFLGTTRRCTRTLRSSAAGTSSSPCS